MTPERFRKQLVDLSPVNCKGRRWRDDRVLMKFLDELWGCGESGHSCLRSVSWLDTTKYERKVTGSSSHDVL